jgi:membrane associated rhomboid family serine protease
MFRWRRGLGRPFTFGGRVPAAVGFLLALTVAASGVSWLLGSGAWAALSPTAIRHGEAWRLVSWAFVQDHPLTLVFGGLMLYSFGTQLARDWGEGRFLWTYLALTVGGALLTVALAVIWPPLRTFGHLGMWPPVIGLLLMWSLRYPDQQLSFWGVLPMTGRTVAILVVAGTLLYGLFGGILQFTPHLATLLIAWAMSGGRLRLPLRRWKLRWRESWLEWRLRRHRKKPRRLEVVRKNGQDEPPRWKN